MSKVEKEGHPVLYFKVSETRNGENFCVGCACDGCRYDDVALGVCTNNNSPYREDRDAVAYCADRELIEEGEKNEG